MLGKNDQQLLDALDVRLSSIVMSPAQSSDRGAMLAVLKMINAQPTPRKRDMLWVHFEKTVGSAIRHLIPELRDVYESLAITITETPAQKRLREVKRKLAAMPASMEGD